MKTKGIHEITFPVFHKGCGGIVFSTTRKMVVGDVLKASLVVLPSGEHPRAGDPIKVSCPRCGERIPGTGGILEYRF